MTVQFKRVSVSTHRKVIENYGQEGADSNPKILKESMELNWNFQKG